MISRHCHCVKYNTITMGGVVVNINTVLTLLVKTMYRCEIILQLMFSVSISTGFVHFDEQQHKRFSAVKYQIPGKVASQ